MKRRSLLAFLATLPVTARAATLRDSGRPAEHVQLVETHGRRIIPTHNPLPGDTVPVGPGHEMVRSPVLRRVSATPDDLHALVRTYRGEGEGEPIEFLLAIAAVNCNRVSSTDPRFARDTSIAAACARPGQFDGFRHQPPMPVPVTAVPFYGTLLLRGAELGVDMWNAGTDITHGAEMFAAVGTHAPWMRDADCTTRIGRQGLWKLRA